MNLRETFFAHQAQTSPRPLGIEVSHADGVRVYDRDGKAYLDFVSGIAVTNVGHRHPLVLRAIEGQLGKYLHVMPYGEFIQEPQVRLAAKIADLLPTELDSTYFVNSGAEANEAALKLSKRYTGRQKLVACRRSYHGSTHGALSVSGNETKKYAYRPLLPEVYFMEFNKLEDLKIIDRRTAGVIVESVQGDAGVRVPDPAWMIALRARCDEVGAVLILDEVQTGFGRTGRFFGFEHFGVVPDVVTMAKSMAGGMPMGAFTGRKELMRCLASDPILGHITTFGGHPLCCAAALGNIRALQSEGLVETCDDKGQLLESLLCHPAIVETRRIGLMFALEFHSADLAFDIVDRCLQKGVIAFYFLSCPESFRLAPPLTLGEEDLRLGAATIMEAIDEAVRAQ